MEVVVVAVEKQADDQCTRSMSLFHCICFDCEVQRAKNPVEHCAIPQISSQRTDNENIYIGCS